jgi:hypothetical protein
MVEPVRHRRTKGAATDMFEPKATASHLDSTRLGPPVTSASAPLLRTYRTSANLHSVTEKAEDQDGKILGVMATLKGGIILSQQKGGNGNESQLQWRQQRRSSPI